MTDYDVAIVGLGALGSAAAYHAAKKGAKVLGLEQYGLGHVNGASHDTSRIIRTSYNEPEYVALAKAAYKDWADLEADAKQKFTTITGGLIFLPKQGGEYNCSQYAHSLDVNNIPYELLDHDTVNKRWPQFNLGPDFEAVYTPDTGIAHAARSVSAMQWLAKFRGADVKENTKVLEVIPMPSGGIILRTSDGNFRAKKVILAADAWTNELIKPLGVAIPLKISQEQVTYFKPTNAADFEDSKFPVWIYGTPKQWYYGFPCFGEPSIKAAHDSAQNFMTPAERTYVPSQKLLEDLKTTMRDFIPDEGREVLRTVTCQYAITPDRQFVIASIPKHPEVTVLLGAAHAFKFAPAIGRVAAELALDGATNENITKFGIPESALKDSKSKL